VRRFTGKEGVSYSSYARDQLALLAIFGAKRG
jgi:hypothetical protein